jgi:hypothetical protein
MMESWVEQVEKYGCLWTTLKTRQIHTPGPARSSELFGVFGLSQIGEFLLCARYGGTGLIFVSGLVRRGTSFLKILSASGAHVGQVSSI